MKNRVLVAGIAGASLGTEIAKCLNLAKNYEIFGCDISSFAYGHYSGDFQKTFLLNIDSYIEDIVNICFDNKIKYIIPGGEQPNILLSRSRDVFLKNNISIISNNSEVVSLCSSKNKLTDFLSENSILTPKRIELQDELNEVDFPCIIKPSEGSGGSNFVYIAHNKKELKNYAGLLISNDFIPVIQEYISHVEGEYTVGILSTTHGEILGGVALQRMFNSKLSIAFKSNDCLISSGYTQGLIDDFPSIIEVCKNISMLLRSTGPINIQGRVKNGEFIPFEINPRFSASTYLRALAGFNEVDFYLRQIINGESSFPYQLKYGYYMRSFEEKYVPKESILS